MFCSLNSTATVQLPWSFCRQSVTVSAALHTRRRPMTWDVDVPPPWRVDSRTTAPPVWSQFSVSQAANEAASALEWCGHVDVLQWRAVLPRSVPTAAVESDCRRCHTAERYSSPVDRKRTTGLTSSWHRLTTNVQSYVVDEADSRLSDRRQWRDQTSLTNGHVTIPRPSAESTILMHVDRTGTSWSKFDEVWSTNHEV